MIKAVRVTTDGKCVWIGKREAQAVKVVVDLMKMVATLQTAQDADETTKLSDALSEWLRKHEIVKTQ